MRAVINHVIQLQELQLIRDEQKHRGTTQHLDQLDQSIAEMKAKLPGDVRVVFEKLSAKDRVVLAPISDSGCAVCGMKLAISMAQAVRLAREIYSCPNCARMLYYPEGAPRWVGRKPSRTEPRKVGISRFSAQSLMIPSLQAEERDGVIAELAGKMEHEGFVDRADRLVESSLRREAIVNTAVDHGLAFPHARGVEGGGLTLAMGLSRKGIRFNPENDQLTKIVFFMAIPTAASAFYLKLLAGLAETFMKAENRKAVLAEETDEDLWKTLIKITRSTVK